MWFDHDLGWGAWLAMSLGMTAFWIVLAALVVAAVRSGRQPLSGRLDAREILARRLARGEIGLDEYQERLGALSRTRR